VLNQSFRYIRAGVALVFAIVIVAGAAYAYRAFATSEFFALRNIELHGDLRAPREEIIDALHKYTEKGLWWTNLEELRDKLRQNPWIRDVELVRVLPDTLKVTITERDPYILARLASGDIVWIDREGVILDEQGTFKSGESDEVELPLLSGLREAGQQSKTETPAPQGKPSRKSDRAAAASGEAKPESPEELRETNKKRLAEFQNIVTELTERGDRLIDRIDEVHFDDVDGIYLQLTNKRIKILAGPGDYRKQVETALQVLDAIERKDIEKLELFRVTDAARLLDGANVAYINTRTPNRVVIGLANSSKPTKG
jgi:Cell division septal protein